MQGITLKGLELYDEAIDTLYRATWDYAYHSAAYFELAQISCIKGDFKKALHQINESLSTNMKNTRAVSLKASILRKMGDFTEAHETFEKVLKTDPLNFRLLNEAYLIAKEEGNSQEAEKALMILTTKMRGFDQNYLELAVGYLNEGMLREADDVLLRYKGNNPIVQYYRGYIQHKYGKSDQAKKLFQKGHELSEEYCFPYRLETIKVLNTALDYNKNDGKAYYYLGNILYNKQPARAITYWDKAVANEPELAMAYRNLGWGYYRHQKDFQKAIPFYEKAISLDNTNAIIFTELDRLYELNNNPVTDRLNLFEGNYEVVNKRDDAFVRMVTVFTLAGKPDKSVEYLKDKVFSYREGDSRVRGMIINAQLTLGLKYLSEMNFEKALDHFLLAQVPDEEAGSANSGNRNIQVNYFIGKAYDALKMKEKAKEHYKLATTAETSTSLGMMSYYQGLCFKELKKKTKAMEVFNQLIDNGDKMIRKSYDDDFFAIFGEKEDENSRFSKAYTLRGLGYKGLDKSVLAKNDLQKAVELSVSNLWATIELSQ